MSMIEKMARALYADETGSDDGWNGPLLQERGREMWRKKARIMLEVMREPTDAMIEAGHAYTDEGAVYRIWQAMSDAALAGS